jgi:homoserine kinase
MSVVYDEMKLPYEIHVSKVNPDGRNFIVLSQLQNKTVK